MTHCIWVIYLSPCLSYAWTINWKSKYFFNSSLNFSKFIHWNRSKPKWLMSFWIWAHVKSQPTTFYVIAMNFSTSDQRGYSSTQTIKIKVPNTRTQSNTGQVSPMFPCDQCDKSCYQLSHLKTHKTMAHQRTRSFACEQCDKRYYRNCDLTGPAGAKNFARIFDDIIIIYSCSWSKIYKTKKRFLVIKIKKLQIIQKNKFYISAVWILISQ